MRARSTAPSGGRGEAGFGLAELLVTISLTSLVLLALGSVFVSDVRTTSRITAKVDTTADVRLAIDTAGRRLRVASDGPGATDPVFTSMGARAVTFYASLEASNSDVNTKPVPSRVTYDLLAVPARGGQCFRETITPPVGSGSAVTYPTSAARTVTLACGTFATARPIFTYYTTAGGATAAAASGDVRAVGIDLSVGAASGGESATTSASLRVGLPNTTFAKETT